MRKNILIVFIIQVILWFLFSVSDYLEENSMFNDASFLLVIISSITIIILYFIFRDDFYYDVRIKKWKELICLWFIWLVQCTIFGSIISSLALNNTWIVHQATGGWEHFLNGIEYPVFAIILALISVLIVFIELIISIVKKVRAK